MSIFDEKNEGKQGPKAGAERYFDRCYRAWQDEQDKKSAWRISLTLNNLWNSMSEDQRQMALSILPENVRDAIKIFNGKVVRYG